MILMLENGRLGNQIFQYLAATQVAQADESIQLFGFDQLRDVFTGLRGSFRSIDSSSLRHLRSLDLVRISQAIPGVGSISENDVGAIVVENRSRIMIMHPAWFQNSAILEATALASMQIREEWLVRAHQVFTSLRLNPRTTAFVHARAGDYRRWPSESHPAILEVDWYKIQAQHMLHGQPELRFVVVGDEPEFRREVAAAIPNSEVIDEGYETEFAVMSLCGSGVCSASSFAFWAAYFAIRASAVGDFIAPNYWAGHRSGKWFPAGIKSGFLRYS